MPPEVVNPATLAKFISLYLASGLAGRRLIRLGAKLLSGQSIEEHSALSNEAHSDQNALEAICLLGQIPKDEWIHCLHQFEKLEPKHETAAISTGDTSWLLKPILRNKDVLLGAILELSEAGHEIVRVHMINDLLTRTGRELTNTHAFLRTLMKEPNLVETVADDGGRHGLSFRLSQRGKDEAIALRARHLTSGAIKAK